MSTPSYTPADDAKTQVFPAGPAFAQPAQEQAGNGFTQAERAAETAQFPHVQEVPQTPEQPKWAPSGAGWSPEERAARAAGRPVLSGAEAGASDDRSTWPHALADGMAVGSLILSLLGFGVIGIVLGAIHASNAHKLRQRASAVGAWGIGIGIAGTVAWALLIIMLIVAAASVSSAPVYGG